MFVCEFCNAHQSSIGIRLNHSLTASLKVNIFSVAQSASVDMRCFSFILCLLGSLFRHQMFYGSVLFYTVAVFLMYCAHQLLHGSGFCILNLQTL